MGMFGKPSRSWQRATLVLLAIFSLWLGGRRPNRPQTRSERSLAATSHTAEGAVRLAEPELVYLEPGTRFRPDEPPTGWCHVVLKSTPTLKTGDLDTLSPETLTMARRIRLAILADVVQTGNAGSHRLRRLGIGLAAPVVGSEKDAGDVIVSTTNVGEHSGDWSTKERIILAAGSHELGRATLAATPTFALLRTPTTGLVAGSHQSIDALYAILVDPAAGGIRLFACKVTGSDALPLIRELESPAIVDGPLDVKAKSFAGFPVSWSFAMIDIPGGMERDIPADLASLLAPDRLDAPDANAIERAFRSYAGLAARTPITRSTTEVVRPGG